MDRLCRRSKTSGHLSDKLLWQRPPRVCWCFHPYIYLHKKGPPVLCGSDKLCPASVADKTYRLLLHTQVDELLTS